MDIVDTQDQSTLDMKRIGMNALLMSHGYSGYSGLVNFGHEEDRDGYSTKVRMDIVDTQDQLTLDMKRIGMDTLLR